MWTNILKVHIYAIVLVCVTIVTACGPTTTPEATTIVASTPTSTSTSVPTGTSTLAPTGTSAPTNTLTAINTSTHTPTPAGTSTYTPTPVSTSTRTPTSTATHTPTPTSTPSPTHTPASPPPGLVVYPYLGNTTTDSVTISWATDGPGASEVRYSESNVVAATTNIYDGKYWHSATITGLTPDTTYYYRIYTAGHDLTSWPEITFTSAPESHQFSFVVLGDGRPDDRSSPPSQAARDVAAQIAQHSFDLALHTGDIVHSGGVCSGENSSWNQYIRSYFDVYRESIGGTPFYPSIGNHELGGGSCGYWGYTDVFAREAYYSFDWGNAHFVALDTSQSYRPGSPQYEWLVSDLQTDSPWKFVFFHYPAYSSGYHGSTSDVQKHLVPLFEAYGVDVVFNGHDHIYERTCPILNGACGEGVVYYVTGGAGASLYSGSAEWFTAFSSSLHHFLKVEVDDCRLRVDGVDGVVFDSYEIDHCGSP